jgi:hypothetical protein
MVKVHIDITDDTNRILNLVKITYHLRDKSQAINIMAKGYKELIFKPMIKVPYLKKMKKISKERTIHMRSIDNFDKQYRIKK